jgi:hypothetical protein
MLPCASGGRRAPCSKSKMDPSSCLYTPEVQFLKFLLSKKHPLTLPLPLKGGGEGGGDSFLVAALPCCAIVSADRALANVSESGMNLEQTDSEADRQDIAGSLAGDGEAYARLVRRYQDRVAAQMWRFTLSALAASGRHSRRLSLLEIAGFGPRTGGDIDGSSSEPGRRPGKAGSF